MLMISKGMLSEVSLVEWPVSWALSRALSDKSPLWNFALLMFDCVHFASRISEKAAMMRRKITGERLSPCLTPTP